MKNRPRMLSENEKDALRSDLAETVRNLQSMRWKPSRCKVNGFMVFRVERQTGPCLRDNYEFASNADGPLEFNSEREAEAMANALNAGIASTPPCDEPCSVS